MNSAGMQTGPGEAGHRVLVVDDNQDAAESLSLLLDMMGNEAHIAYDGLQALEMAAALKPDIVLLDIGLPVLNGHDTARRMRADSTMDNVVLVALTGWGEAEDRRRSREAGFDYHLVKPVQIEDLEKILAHPVRVAA